MVFSLEHDKSDEKPPEFIVNSNSNCCSHGINLRYKGVIHETQIISKSLMKRQIYMLLS
jgi:hypothetical protein